MGDLSDKTYEIWCDGSYRQQGKRAGAGVVVRCPDGTFIEEAIVLPKPSNDFKKFGSYYAELEAAAHALEHIPDEAIVRLNMDCKDVLNTLQGGEVKHGHIPSLLSSFQRAALSISRMAHVTLSYMSDKEYYMSQAHQLSRRASDAPANKSDHSYKLNLNS